MSRGAILVTGGAGFIGSHACKQLACEGWTPVVVDDLSTGHEDAVRFGPFHRMDIRDTAGLRRVMRAHRIKTLMHFAASAYVGESVSNPLKYYANNVEGMRSVLEAAVAENVGRIVFSSSCATYGMPRSLPISEDAGQNPISPYGRTKLICELMLADFRAAHGLDYCALRYFNACGADPEGELSERHDPEPHLIPIALMAASGRGGPLTIYGDDYDTPDGTCIRDFIHVADLADAHARAARYLADGGPSVALNLGTGAGLSVRQIVEAINAVSTTPVPVVMGKRRPGDPDKIYADPRRALKVLGWRARYSDIDTIIRHAAPTFGLECRRKLHRVHLSEAIRERLGDRPEGASAPRAVQLSRGQTTPRPGRAAVKERPEKSM